MKREARKRVSLLIIIAVMILTVTGCGDKKEESKQTSSESVQESQNTSEDEKQSTSNEGQESTFDFSQAFDNVEVNGKKVPFPFTLNDLGEDFTVEAVTEMGDGTCCGTLYYKKSERLASVFMFINSKDMFDNNTKINRFDLMESCLQIINVNGIDCNSSVINVKEKFVGLEEKYNSKNVLSFLKKIQNNNVISIHVDINGKVTSVSIQKGE